MRETMLDKLNAANASQDNAAFLLAARELIVHDYIYTDESARSMCSTALLETQTKAEALMDFGFAEAEKLVEVIFEFLSKLDDAICELQDTDMSNNNTALLGAYHAEIDSQKAFELRRNDR
jgi:hypothetical protein